MTAITVITTCATFIIVGRRKKQPTMNKRPGFSMATFRMATSAKAKLHSSLAFFSLSLVSPTGLTFSEECAPFEPLNATHDQRIVTKSDEVEPFLSLMSISFSCDVSARLARLTPPTKPYDMVDSSRLPHGRHSSLTSNPLSNSICVSSRRIYLSEVRFFRARQT
jgi:hypothetical protein